MIKLGELTITPHNYNGFNFLVSWRYGSMLCDTIETAIKFARKFQPDNIVYIPVEIE